MHDHRARLFLADEAATLVLGRALAVSLPGSGDIPMVLLRAPLGSGKTTLARGFVSALPGAEDAEVSSPSFNLANIYPTRPRVAHVDLYRLGEGVAASDLEELLEAGPDERPGVVLVEWAEYLPEDFLPASRLDIELTQSGDGRTADVAAHGPDAEAWLTRTLSTYLQSGTS